MAFASHKQQSLGERGTTAWKWRLGDGARVTLLHVTERSSEKFFTTIAALLFRIRVKYALPLLVPGLNNTFYLQGSKTKQKQQSLLVFVDQKGLGSSSVADTYLIEPGGIVRQNKCFEWVNVWPALVKNSLQFQLMSRQDASVSHYVELFQLTNPGCLRFLPWHCPSAPWLWLQHFVPESYKEGNSAFTISTLPPFSCQIICKKDKFKASVMSCENLGWMLFSNLKQFQYHWKYWEKLKIWAFFWLPVQNLLH